MRFRRFQARQPSRSGRFPGVFALVNGLGRAGRLSELEATWWRRMNRWFETHMTDPGLVDPSTFDRALHPRTSSWFRSDAERFIDAIQGYLEILDAHGVDWVELACDDPGPVLYGDEHQVVVAAQHDPASLATSVSVRRVGSRSEPEAS